MTDSLETAAGVVALFNASDDTVQMIQKILTDAAHGQSLIWCHFADLKTGVVNFEKYMEKHNPEVVIFDLSPPYDANWTFFKKMRDDKAMKGRGVVLTTTNKDRLDEVLGEDSHALEIVGKSDDLCAIGVMIARAQCEAEALRAAGVDGPKT